MACEDVILGFAPIVVQLVWFGGIQWLSVSEASGFEFKLQIYLKVPCEIAKVL